MIRSQKMAMASHDEEPTGIRHEFLELVKDQKEFDFKLPGEGHSVTLIYELNLL